MNPVLAAIFGTLAIVHGAAWIFVPMRWNELDAKVRRSLMLFPGAASVLGGSSLLVQAIAPDHPMLRVPLLLAMVGASFAGVGLRGSLNSWRSTSGDAPKPPSGNPREDS